MKWLRNKIGSVGNRIVNLPVAAKVVLGVVLLVTIFGGSYGSYRMYNYTQHDPSFCRSCHTMETAWAKWETSEHSNVGCHSCHTVSPIGGAQLIMAYLIDKPDINENHAHIPDKACEKCHYSGDPKWVQVEQTAGHEAHAEGQNISCQTCHGLRLHEFRPAVEICMACHADHVTGHEKAIKVESMQDLHCVECHGFLTDESTIRPVRETCLSCHQKLPSLTTSAGTGPVTFPGQGPMTWDCKECHKPHDRANPVSDCISCHTTAKTEGAHGISIHSQQQCVACHTPHEWTVTQRDSCLTCHQDKVAHNAGRNCADCHTQNVGPISGFGMENPNAGMTPENTPESSLQAQDRASGDVVAAQP
ncbi:MAG: cytochrome c3 family protein [Thermoleophilia bacterium]|nr:cytochrome c3 family protein [Thermoleophilia bacterium]